MDPAHPVRPRVHNIVGGGDDEWAAVEMTNTSKTVTGMDYNNTFCWVTRWNPEGKIVQVSSISFAPFYFFFFFFLLHARFAPSCQPCLNDLGGCLKYRYEAGKMVVTLDIKGLVHLHEADTCDFSVSISKPGEGLPRHRTGRLHCPRIRRKESIMKQKKREFNPIIMVRGVYLGTDLDAFIWGYIGSNLGRTECLHMYSNSTVFSNSL